MKEKGAMVVLDEGWTVTEWEYDKTGTMNLA